ncbi:MAG: hypothetical protein AAFY98_12150, partial [Verrucomicrobiota bacterium]
MKKYITSILTIAICFSWSTRESNAQQTWTAGHGDIGVAYDGSDLELEWHLGEDNETVVLDGSNTNFGIPGQGFETGDIIAETSLSGSRNPNFDWDFLGVNGGETFYTFPDPEDFSTPYIGFGTEELTAADWTGNLTLSLMNITRSGVTNG